MRASPGFPNEGEVKEWWSEIVPPLQLWKKYKYFFQVKKGGKYSGAAQSLWPSAREWFFLFYLQRSFFVCSVRFLFAAFRLFAVGIFYLQRSFLFAAYFFYLQRTFFICSVLFYLQRFIFVCSVSFLFATFLFCLQRFFFVCSVSFLFTAFLFCLQRVPCGPS